MRRADPAGKGARRACSRVFLAALLASGLASASFAAEEAEPAPLPPSPAAILGLGLPRTPPIDAVPLCTRWSVHERSEGVLAADGPEAALAGWRAAGVSPPGADLFTAALEARLAEDDRALEAARAAIRRALDEEAPEVAKVCALLEVSRAELRLSRFPEAAASARETLRAALRWSETIVVHRDRARFLVAEAYLLGGRSEDAAALYLALTRADAAPLAAAARLRLADLRFDRGRRASALPEYEVLLENGAAFGAEPDAWAARAAEAAIASGDFASAASWLDRQPAADDDDRALATLRRADVLVGLGKRDEAREELEGVDAALPDQALGRLARVRIFDFGLERAQPEEALDALREVANEARHPGVAGYARVVLARRVLAQRDVAGSLPLLVQASYDVAASSLLDEARTRLASAVELAVSLSREAGGCSWLVQILDDHRSLLVNTAEQAAPFLVLGGCYEEVGLPLAALDVYRGVTRRFGAGVAAQVSLPIARASLASGKVAAARTAAEARVEQQASPDPAWWLLLAKVRWEERRPDDALALLGRLVEAVAPQPIGPEALRLLARSARAARPSAAARALLREALARQPAAATAREAVELAEAALLAADLHRHAGEAGHAADLYARVLDPRAPEAVVAEAAYWLAQLDASQRARALELAAAAPDEPYARLIRSQRALELAALRMGLAGPPKPR